MTCSASSISKPDSSRCSTNRAPGASSVMCSLRSRVALADMLRNMARFGADQRCAPLGGGGRQQQVSYAVPSRTGRMRIKPQLDHVVIVLVGRFNPAIFQPAWFALHNMVGKKEAEAAHINAILGEISQFKIDPFEIQVLPERFTITSLDAHPEHIRDLVISCFGQCLPHTPIRAMGINRLVHFDTGDFETRDRVGSRLAPKDAWGSWGREIEVGPREPPEARGGMISIVMRQSSRPDGHKGHVQAKVEPSTRVASNSGVFVDVNDHFELSNPEQEVQDASSAVAMLEGNWEASLQRSAMIIDQLMALAEECRA